jgi:hypothetical protein
MKDKVKNEKLLVILTLVELTKFSTKFNLNKEFL